MLRDVCDKVLDDESVSKETRKNRAVALKIVGSVFSKVRPDISPDDVPMKPEARTSSSSSAT